MTNASPLWLLSTETSECKNITHLFGVCWSKSLCLCHTINNDISGRESTAQILADPQHFTCLGKQTLQLHMSNCWPLNLMLILFGWVWFWFFCFFVICLFVYFNNFCFSRMKREAQSPIRGRGF